MQLAQVRVQGSSTAGVARQPATTGLCTHTPHSTHTASHGLNLCSRASQTAEGERTCSHQQHPGDTHGTSQGSTISESAAQHALCGQAPERFSHSALERARSCDSLASALTAVVDFLLHGVLDMQPCSLQRSYAGSAFSFIHAIQPAWPGESHILASVLDRLSSGLSEAFLHSIALRPQIIIDSTLCGLLSCWSGRIPPSKLSQFLALP